MDTEFYELLESIRLSNSYEEVKSRGSVIIQKMADATDPAVIRTLRDAQVYALAWGVFIAAYEDDCEVSDNAISSATKSVADDAASAAQGKDGRDAIADAYAAEMASADISAYLNGPNPLYPSEGAGPEAEVDSLTAFLEKQEKMNAKKAQIEELISPVTEACNAYMINEHVTRSRLTNDLKQLLGQYLLVWRKTTSSGGSPLSEQGILESIDEENGTFVLKSTTYEDQRSTLSFSDIGFIDKTRTGSGSKASVSAPGWHQTGYGTWVRTDS